MEAVRGRGTTVVLVTHFMDEAQRLCDRLAVLVRGRVVASGTADELVDAHFPQKTVRFTIAEGTDLTFLLDVKGVQRLDRRPGGGQVVVSGEGPLLARIGHALGERGFEPEDLRADVPTLEDAYLSLTSRSHADSEATL